MTPRQRTVLIVVGIVLLLFLLFGAFYTAIVLLNRQSDAIAGIKKLQRSLAIEIEILQKNTGLPAQREQAAAITSR